jgi:hypothetical protein
MAWSDAARAAAAEVRRQRALRLFHGTSSIVKRVTPKTDYRGARGIFLTDNPKEARGFAVAAARFKGGKPVVYMVRRSSLKNATEMFSPSGKSRWFISPKAIAAFRKLKVK